MRRNSPPPKSRRKVHRRREECPKQDFWFRWILPWCNQHYTLPVESVYREIPKGVDLSLVFSIKQQRKVRKNNTISYEGRIYQLLSAHSFRNYAGRWVEVCETLEGTLQLCLTGKAIPYQAFEKPTCKQLKEEAYSTPRSSLERVLEKEEGDISNWE